MLRVPWFTGLLEASHGSVVSLCVPATLGDVLILLAVQQLGFIRRAKALGFTLAEIRELLALAEPTGDRGRVNPGPAQARHDRAPNRGVVPHARGTRRA